MKKIRSTVKPIQYVIAPVPIKDRDLFGFEKGDLVVLTDPWVRPKYTKKIIRVDTPIGTVESLDWMDDYIMGNKVPSAWVRLQEDDIVVQVALSTLKLHAHTKIKRAYERRNPPT